MEALNATIALLRKLGFSINWKKVVDPSTTITFLRIEIDSVAVCLWLPEDKIIQIGEENDPRQTCGRVGHYASRWKFRMHTVHV